MQENLSYVPENNTTDLPQTSAANKHKHARLQDQNIRKKWNEKIYERHINSLQLTLS